VLPAVLPARELQFDDTVIDAGFLVSQPVQVASLTGSGRQVVLAGRTRDHAQRLAVYEVDQPDEPVLEIEAPPHLIAFDIGRFVDSDQLFFIEPGGITRFDFEQGEIVEFISIRSIYGQKRSGMLMPIDFIRDINGDELDDVVVPDTGGYRIRLQRDDGRLGDEIVLQGSSAMAVFDGRVTFRSLPLVSGDMTGDGLPDLAVWRGDELHVYQQRAEYSFNSEPQVIKLQLGLQTEAEQQSRSDGFGSVNQEGLVETRIWSVEDLNGDNLPDILTESMLNEGVFDKENDFRMHLGRLVGDFIDYRESEDALLASSGLQYGLTTTDLNGDDRQDLLVRKVQMSFGRVMRALLSGNVPMELHVYRMSDDDTYDREANFTTKTNVQLSVRSGHVDVPAILVADLDNDGLKDLLVQTDSDELSVQFGIRKKGLFDEDPVTRKVRLPRNGELVAVENLNDDGKDDLIIRYDESDGESPAQTVRLLISR
jgi:hypothetical protein